MRLVDRAFLDPAANQVDLLLRHRHLGLGGRHDLVRVVADHALEGHALLRMTGHDRAPLALGEWSVRLFLKVESQPGLAVAGVGAVTGEAAVRQDGADLVAEGNRLRLRGSGGQHGAYE